MKKKFILIFISSLFLSANALELNIFISRLGGELNFINRNVDTNITPRDIIPNINILRGENSKGNKIFKKYFQKPCNMSAKTFASKHTQDEWEEIAESGTFEEHIIKLCPSIKDIYRKEWTEELYKFFYKYAYDSEELLIS